MWILQVLKKIVKKGTVELFTKSLVSRNKTCVVIRVAAPDGTNTAPGDDRPVPWTQSTMLPKDEPPVSSVEFPVVISWVPCCQTTNTSSLYCLWMCTFPSSRHTGHFVVVGWCSLLGPGISTASPGLFACRNFHMCKLLLAGDVMLNCLRWCRSPRTVQFVCVCVCVCVWGGAAD